MIYRVTRIALDRVSPRKPTITRTNTPLDVTVAEDDSTKSSKKSKKPNKMQSMDPCRICLSGYFSQRNPLIMPCKCQGTMRNIHVRCLQQWLQTKVVGRDRGCSKTYHMKSLACELCKEPLPKELRVNGKDTDLIQIEYPTKNFMVLEYFNEEKESTLTHILDFSKTNQINVGRARGSDIRINDPSVSRKHAIMTAHKSGIYLEDNNSKFGTLAQIKNQIVLQPGRTMYV